MVAYADRARLMDDHRRKRVFPANGLVAATLLVDGFVRGVWNIAPHGDAATLRIELFEPLSDEDRTAVIEEAEGLLAFAAGDAGTREVRLT